MSEPMALFDREVYGHRIEVNVEGPVINVTVDGVWVLFCDEDLDRFTDAIRAARGVVDVVRQADAARKE